MRSRIKKKIFMDNENVHGNLDLSKVKGPLLNVTWRITSIIIKSFTEKDYMEYDKRG